MGKHGFRGCLAHDLKALAVDSLLDHIAADSRCSGGREIPVRIHNGRVNWRVVGVADHLDRVLVVKLGPQLSDDFIENFRKRGEVGASACVTFEGETVLDVWGGLAEPATGSAWNEDEFLCREKSEATVV